MPNEVLQIADPTTVHHPVLVMAQVEDEYIVIQGTKSIAKHGATAVQILPDYCEKTGPNLPHTTYFNAGHQFPLSADDNPFVRHLGTLKPEKLAEVRRAVRTLAEPSA